MTDEKSPVPTLIDGTTVIARRTALAWVEVEGEVVIYDEESGHLHLLDTMGALVWQLLDGQAPLALLADEIGEALSHDRDVIENDLVGLTMDLLQRFLIEVVT